MRTSHLPLLRQVLFLALNFILFPVTITNPNAPAAEWYVGPKASTPGQGTREAPWSLEGTLLGKYSVRPGDTLFLLDGIYRRRPQELYEVRLAGTEAKPIQVRPAPGARARIDGGLLIQDPSAFLWVRDLELFVSEPNPEKPVSPGSHPSDFPRPWGGLTMTGGRHCKYIHLVIHDCRQGVSFWKGAENCELYGCLIYDNGWPATDRGHGHAIYTQNNEGIKTIADCIMTGGYSYTMHAFGSSHADVNNYLVEGNICYHAGPFLIGGGRPSRHIRVFRNLLYGVPMQLGYNAPYNEDCEVRENLLVNSSLSINKYKKAIQEGNTILAKQAQRPPGVQVFLRPSKYQPGRAHLAIFNWEGKSRVKVEPGTVLKTGDRYRLLDPRDFFGEPLFTGTYHGQSIVVPMKGEFASFVLLKE
jgi:hypothetical protein